MATSAQQRGRKLKRPREESQRMLIEQLQAGNTVMGALTVIGMSRSWYEQQRRSDADFRNMVDRTRQEKAEAYTGLPDGAMPSFEEFSEQYLGATVFPHMLNVVDLMEGKEPRWLHPAMTFEAGEKDMVIVNCPPESSKSTTITMNYVTYRIACDPNIRVLLVSKTQTMAKKFLYGIKTRLTHPKYAAFQQRFGPPSGYASGSESWSQDMIYIGGEARDSGEKDPTVQALGIRGQIYGARADLIILDDCVDNTNAHEFEKQIDWITSEVTSRISASGSLLVVGTRLASRDMYLELRAPKRYPDEESPWTYLAMPAVLDFAEKPKDWVTLWPKSNQMEIGAKGELAVPDENGLYPKWDGPRLTKKRARMQPRTWAMLYMQETVSEDAIFSQEAVAACINGNRMTGLIPKGMVNCRPNGMEGLVAVAGLDPATSGFTAATIIGLDVPAQKRYVLDVYNKAGTTPDAMREMIYAATDKYKIVEWVIEKNSFQGFLVADRELNEFMASRGCRIRPHFTGANKMDPDFGVASMATLFAGWRDGNQLIELPSTAITEAAKALVQQLVTWYPGAPKTVKTDALMSMWFAEIACRERIQAGSGYRSHARNQFATPYDRRSQHVVDLSEMQSIMGRQPAGVFL